MSSKTCVVDLNPVKRKFFWMCQFYIESLLWSVWAGEIAFNGELLLSHIVLCGWEFWS